MKLFRTVFFFGFLLLFAERARSEERIELGDGSRVVLIGNGLGSRMMHYGHFETEVQRRNSGKHITIRNMCDEGNTPGYRRIRAAIRRGLSPGRRRIGNSRGRKIDGDLATRARGILKRPISGSRG